MGVPYPLHNAHFGGQFLAHQSDTRCGCEAKALLLSFIRISSGLKLYFRLLAGNTLLAGDELLPVYPQQNSAFGADVYGRFELKARVRLFSLTMRIVPAAVESV